jgi:hypothetical protein
MRLSILEGGIWFPGSGGRPFLKPMTRLDLVRRYAGLAERVEYLLTGGPVRHMVIERGIPLNLRLPGLLLTLPFLPLLHVSGERVKALKGIEGWLLEGELDDLDDIIRRARWRMALQGEAEMQRWQMGLTLSEDDPEAEALSTVLDKGEPLPLPHEHYLLRVRGRGPFLLVGPSVGVRVLSTAWSTEAVRLARAVMGGSWVSLDERRVAALYRDVLPADLGVKRVGEEWHLKVGEERVILTVQGDHWVIGKRKLPKSTEKPDKLTLLWAARVGVSRRARRFWKMNPANAPLAMARGMGAGLLESLMTYRLVWQRERICSDCGLSFVIGGQCLNAACPSRHTDELNESPVVYGAGGCFVYAPFEPGWIEVSKGGEIRGVMDDMLTQFVQPERIVIKRGDGRSALLVARLLSFTDREPEIDAELPLPTPVRWLIKSTWREIEHSAPFASRFVEALEMLCRGTESGVQERSNEGVLTR